VAEAWLAALNAHRAEAILKVMDAEGTFEDPTSDGPLPVGQIEPFWSDVWRTFPDLSFTALRMVATGDHVVIEWQASGKDTSGQPIAFSGVYALDLRNERVVCARAYYNPSVYWPFLAPNLSR
jgi:ketosteroid isomerase-like protein